jgi:AraC family transcriptional regulator of adaptative response/methylated-DNA-[protein]-cysteine methyltransferase
MPENDLFPSEAELWRAVVERDPRYNGRAFYAVRSTGIYCRPDCPSRRPRREQVVFFAAPQQAEAAGFRACRRCRPRQAAAPPVERVAEAARLIEREGLLSLAELGRRLEVSPYHLQRTFKAVTGVSPRQYAARLKAGQFKNGVRAGQDVTAALYEAGYGSSSRLYESAPAQLGMTPAAYRRGGKAMTIHYTLSDSPLGRMLVAATERGVCAVYFGDEDAPLEAALAGEYPAARRVRDGAELTRWVAALLFHLAGQQPHLDLPLDVQATAFQQRVWAELRRIPYGETRSYTQVAEAIGRPSAARAVARACATNPAAVLTPCHRVLRSDGSLGGYRWGLHRKQALLEKEKKT